jgi:aminoglycoside 3-N-acetyltransferase
MKRMGTAMTENGERRWKWFMDFEYDSDDFEKLGEDFEANNVVRRGKVGNAQCRLFSLKSGVDYAKGWLQENRFHR